LFLQVDDSVTHASPTTDSLIEILLGPHHSSEVDERVFIDIFSGEDATSFLDSTAPPTLNIGRLGPLTQVPNQPFWKAEELFEVYVECLMGWIE
jgi:hypothetical protein